MKHARVTSLVLAALLQIVPVCRDAILSLIPDAPQLAIVFRWIVGFGVYGAYNAVSGASTVITSPTTATATNGVPFTYRITCGPEVPNTFNAYPLPAALTVNTTTGRITGTPTTNGVFAITIVASDNNIPSHTTSATLTLTVVPGVVAVAPAITANPTNLTITAGNAATFNVTATGTAPLSYQWKFNGGNITGATSASYSIANAQAGNAGSYSVVVSNSAGTATSSAATLTVNPAPVAPAISAGPTNLTVTAGNAASFSVTATGTAPLSYQWKFNGGNIVGATGASYTIANAQAGNAGSYSVLVSNVAGSVTSAAANLTVNPAPVAPTISAGPTNLTITAGNPATFSVTATGTAPMSYQWKFNGSDITGATGTSYTIANAQAGNAGGYSVLVSNVAGAVTSAAASLTVNPAPVAPSITGQPANQSVVAGGAASFSVTVTGTAPLSYQWRFNGANIPGATSASYGLTNCQTNQAGTYSVLVSNSVGTATSNGATLTVTPAAVAPSITTSPTNLTVTAGSAATFNVGASGTAPLTYQWKFNGGDITGATGASYTIANAQAGNAGSYSVVVSNSVGTATSAAASLTVNAAVAPSITSQPANQTVTAGNPATFSVAASGTAPMSYQWKFNGGDITGATGTSYTIANAQAGHAGSYSVVVSNVAGAVTSAAASLTVNPAPVAPSITSQPAGQTVTVGGDASFSVTANGTAPIFYQWRRNGVNLAGATSASLALSNCQTNQAGTYSVIVSNSVGSVASSGALLAVDVPTTPFSLTITGQGNVTPNLSGQNLVIGANYTITAVPHAGNGFAGWSGSLTGTNVSLTFTMQPGLALTAAFQPVISTNVTGSYCGLFYEGAGARYETAGLVEMTARNGRVIGALKIGASRFAFRQQLDATGAGSAIARAAAQAPLTVNLQADLTNSASVITGIVSNGLWQSNLLSDQASTNRPCGFAGTYQVPIPDTSGTASNFFLTARVTTLGRVMLNGRLPTGVLARQTTRVSPDGVWPLYVPFRDGHALIGWVTLQDPVTGSVDADIHWLTRGAP